MIAVTAPPEPHLAVRCPACGAPPTVGCYLTGDQTHRLRKQFAKQIRTYIGCRCNNHMGTPKAQHKSRAAALQWCIRGAAKRGVAGMRFEPYPCPTSNRWHIRTARKVTL